MENNAFEGVSGAVRAEDFQKDPKGEANGQVEDHEGCESGSLDRRSVSTKGSAYFECLKLPKLLIRIFVEHFSYERKYLLVELHLILGLLMYLVVTVVELHALLHVIRGLNLLIKVLGALDVYDLVFTRVEDQSGQGVPGGKLVDVPDVVHHGN